MLAALQLASVCCAALGLGTSRGHFALLTQAEGREFAAGRGAKAERGRAKGWRVAQTRGVQLRPAAQGHIWLGSGLWLDGRGTAELWPALVRNTRLMASLHASGNACFSKEIALRIGQFLEQAGRAELGLMVKQPSRQQSAGMVLDPLIQQDSNFPAEVGCVVQAGEFVAFERRFGSEGKVLPRRVERLGGHLGLQGGDGRAAQAMYTGP